MNCFQTLLNLLDFPSTVEKEIVELYNHCTNNEEDICELECSFSNETRQILMKSLTTQSYESSTIIQRIRKAYKLKHNQAYDDLISFTITNFMEFAYQDTQNEIDTNKIYKLLSLLKFCDDQENIIERISPKIDQLVKEEKINKDFIYLSLFPQSNILQKFLKYEKESFNIFNLNDSSSLFRYCLYKNRHWLFHIIENDTDLNLINNIIEHKLFFLKLTHFTNVEPVNITYLNNIILKISKYKITDNFLNTLIKEVKWNISLYQNISKINPCIKNAFQFSELKSCLDIISSYINLKDTNHYEDINEILIQHEKYLTDIYEVKLTETSYTTISEVDLYNGFCILTLIEYYITDNKNENFLQERVQELFKKTKLQLLQSKNVDYQLEIFENIFTLLFLRRTDTKNTHFLCGNKEIYYISTLLKTTLKEMKRKLSEEKRSSSRFIILQSYVHDTLWRLEFLKTLNIQDITINLMLSSSNTLIYLCLADNNFEKAHDVIQEYKLENTEIAKEIEYLERLRYLKSEENINCDEIIKFCSESKLIQSDIFKNTFTKFSENNIIKNITSENEKSMNILDVIITTNNITLNKELFGIQQSQKRTYSCSYTEFCYNLQQIFNHFNNKISVYEILFSQLPLNIIELEKRERYFEDLETTSEEFKQLLPTEKSEKYKNEQICKPYLKLIEICSNESNYLYKLYNYLKLFVNLLDIKKDNNYVLLEERGDCIFNLLYIYPSKIVAKLLANKLNPKEFEHLFASLKLDIIYHISWNCLPEIDLRMNTDNKINNLISSNNFKEFLKELKQISEEYIENILFVPNIYVVSYIRKRNWLLAYLINKVYLIEEAKPDTNNPDRTKYFNNFLNLPNIKTLQKIFDNNSILTAFYHEIPINKIISHFETANWNEMLDILNGLPEIQIRNNKNLIKLRDIILYNLVNEGKTVQEWGQVEWICDNNLKIECISKNLFIWPGNFCTEILSNQLSNYSLNVEQRSKLQIWFTQINLYENIKIHFNLECWNDIYKKSKDNLEEVFRLLLTSKEIDLLLKWIEIEKCTNLLHLITTDYFLLIIEENVELNFMKTLLDLLKFDQRIQICKELMKHVRKLNYLEFIVNYLITLLPEIENEYKNYIISLKILICFNLSEHEYMFCLISKPLLILEQLLMNVRLEKLSLVLDKISPILKDFQDKNIPIDVSLKSIDLLLRTYAQKSLDFRGIQPSNGLRNLELKLMQSLDTVSETSDKKIFVMPVQVPDKKDWIENEKALECMCCCEVTFSMFNRRHHCRRCGRIICGNCSYKRLEIPEYGSIPVRVCNDCFKYSKPEDKNSSHKSELSSNKSGSLIAWLLTDDEKHNDLVREEFSYEYAPSVSLCLSILKSHSISVEYVRFLLEQSKILLPYLQESVSEIDFSFIIQMIKSLVTVAKVTSLHNSYKAELSQCNEILLHVELLKLLVEKDCLELLRSANKNLSDFYIDSGVLRRLRDKLIEQEQWLLALDICTKVGLDKTGIFAAWGKSYLKAGCLQLAREKFQYCLEKHYDTSDLSISLDPEDFRNKKSVTLSTVSETRAIKTPPLVNEIISVLESNGKICDRSVFKTFEKICLNSSTLSLNTNCGTTVDPAVCILNKLKNLNTITGQNQKRKISKTTMPKFYYIEPCFYNECLYYLMRYGSHYSILQFYIRHDEIDDALNYILENRIQTDIFIDIYMKCLENGKIEIFQEHMVKIDSTLNIWENYLKAICRHLESNSMFNILYQLQIFMTDYVRASMTCIKFYQENANTFRELLEREEYLQKAQMHLKQELEAEQWVQISSDRKHSTGSSGSSHSSRKSHEISLIMKIDPRNIDKYINTIWRQIEATKFLAECEMENRPTLQVLNEIFTFSEDEKLDIACKKIPTLFDSQLEKTKLAVLMVVCGKNVEEGFGIAFRIIQEQNLKYLKVYCLAGKYLAQTLRDDAVTELINCIQSSGLNADAVNETCDEVLMTAVSALTKANGTGVQLENLIKLINDSSVKIDAYIESKQLKRAYLLAIRQNKISDIKKILKEAERLNQSQIKAICLKRLNPSS